MSSKVEICLLLSTFIYITSACSSVPAMKKYLVNHMSGKLNIPLTYTTSDPLFHYDRDQTLLNARLEWVQKIGVVSIKETSTSNNKEVTVKLKFKELRCKYERYATNDPDDPETRLFWSSACTDCTVSVKLGLSNECSVSTVTVDFDTMVGLYTNLVRDTGLSAERIKPALQQMNQRDKLIRDKLTEALVNVFTGLSLKKKGIMSC